MKMELADGPVHFVTTVSSDGNINIHDLTRSAEILQANSAEDIETPPIATYDTKGSRLVCCCTAEVFRGKSQLQGKTEVKEETAGVKDEDGSVDGGDDFYGLGGDAESDPEEEEDPVWQEFSQEYYEGVSSRLLSPVIQAHRMSEQWWNNSHWRSIGISHSFEN